MGCVKGVLSVSESVQRESEQLANEGTSVNEGWKVVSICLWVRFYWYSWRAKSTVLFKCSGNHIIGNLFSCSNSNLI